MDTRKLSFTDIIARLIELKEDSTYDLINLTAADSIEHRQLSHHIAAIRTAVAELSDIPEDSKIFNNIGLK